MKLPSALDVENRILGAGLLSVEGAEKVSTLSEDLFMTPQNKQTLLKIKENVSKGVPADTGIDSSTLAYYLSDISTDIDGHTSVLEEKRLARALIEVCRTAMADAYAGISPDSLSSRIIDVLSKNSSTGSTINSLDRSLYEVVKRINDVREGLTSIGLTTDLDFERRISGFEDGKFYVVAARPAMGKSAFALEVIKRVATTGVPVGMMSLEMSHTSLAMRLLTSEVGIDAGKLKLGQISDDQLDIVIQKAGELSNLPIYFDDNSYVTSASLRGKALTMKRDKDIGMLVIDYLQLMSGENTSRERDIAEVSRMCKVISKDLSIPVIALAQLNRGVEIRDNKRPRLSDLRESGAIEQDADVVMFLYRPEYYGIDFYGDDEPTEIRGTSTKNICEIIVAKNRDGETGMQQQVFIPELMQFKNLAYKPMQIQNRPPSSVSDLF